MPTTRLVQAPPDRLRYLRDLQRQAAASQAAASQRYYSDPVAFAADCIDWRDGAGLTAYQQAIIGDLPARKRISVRSPHGTGKSCLSAVTILWFALTREAAGVDWKVATTAGSWHQISKFLWREIHRWAVRVRWDKVRGDRPLTAREEMNVRLRGHPFSPGELMNLNLRLNHGAAFASASANSALIEGAHADSLLFVFDEAKAIPAATFDACEGALNGTGEAFALCLSTPGAPSGRFYDIQSRKPGYEDWHAVHVTLAQAIAAGQIDAAWAAQRARQWGEQSSIYQNRVLGEFHAGDEDSVIPLAWAEAAVERWHEWDLAGRPGTDMDYPRTAGVDVARFGTAKTVIAVRNGPALLELRRTSKEDTMATTGRVKAVLDADEARTAVVDVIGIGAGVVDRLREMGAKVQAFNASAGTDRIDVSGEFGFSNCLTGDARVLPIGGLMRIYRSRYEGPLFEVKTAGGDQFTATPNHQVLTLRGWVPVQLLRPGDKLCNASAKNAAGTGLGPEVDDVPPKLSEVYRAGHIAFGSERVQGRAVNFHGDRPAGEVDVVTIGRDLLTVGPSCGQHGKYGQLVRLLALARSLSPESALTGSLEVHRRNARVAPPFPGDGMLACADGALIKSEPVENEVVGLGDAAGLDAVVAQDTADRPRMVAECERQGLDRLACEVSPHNLGFIKGDEPEAPGFRSGARGDATFAQDTAHHVPVNPERAGQRVGRLAGRVASDKAGGIDVLDVSNPGGLFLAPWLDSVFVEDFMNGGPVGPVELAQRTKRLAGDIPLNEVVFVELASPAHEAPFVYTMETSTGAYCTINTVHRNCRSAAWWGMREQLDPSAGSVVCLPDDEMLLGDLSAPQWKVTSGGKIAVESKDEIEKRLGRSTDDGDATVMAYFPRSLPHSPSARQWAAHGDLERLSEDRSRRRPGGPDDRDRRDGWDSPDAWAPQDDDGRPDRPNVRSWR